MSEYTPEALAKQAEFDRLQAAGEKIPTSVICGILETTGRSYGACPTQLHGTDKDGHSFYFRARHGDWDLEVDGKLIASGEDRTGGMMDPDDVDKIVTEYLGAHWVGNP